MRCSAITASIGKMDFLGPNIGSRLDHQHPLPDSGRPDRAILLF
jgi:hypothetical protein